MRRQCGRPGCSATATATFSFDATRCVVWLDALSDGAARAGDLCTRHADSLAPPSGWERIDRRPAAPTAASAPAAPATVTVTPLARDAKPRRKAGGDDLLPARRRNARRKRWSEVPSLFESDLASSTSTSIPPATSTPPAAAAPPAVDAPPESEVAPAPDVPAAPDTSPASWLPRNASDDDLDGVLDASTPLLARAFRNARPAGSDADDEPDDD